MRVLLLAVSPLICLTVILSVWGQLIIFFSIFNFNVSIGMSLKGMIEKSLLFEDEPLTPNIDKVMPV